MATTQAAPGKKGLINFDFLQKLGKVLMTVIAVMPAAGLMISLGKLVQMGGGDIAAVMTIGTTMENIGWAVINNLHLSLIHICAVRFPFNLYPCTIPGDIPLIGRAGRSAHLHQPRAPLDKDQLHALLPVQCHLREISRNGAGTVSYTHLSVQTTK